MASFQCKVGINGLGVLGRRLLRMLLDGKLNTFDSDTYEFQVVAINDVNDPEQLVYLLKYDTVYGKWKATIEYDSEEGNLVIDGQNIVLYQKAPTKDAYWGEIRWEETGAEIVFDCTGFYTSYTALDSHISGGAKYVIGLAETVFDPTIPMFAFGINHKTATKEEVVYGIPAAQIIANSIIGNVLNETFGVDCGICMDVGSYTNLNNLQDSALSSQRNTPQNGRAGAWNLIYSGRDYGKPIGRIVPALNGKLIGQEIRSGTIRGAISCGNYTLQESFDADSFLGAWKTLVPSSMQDADKAGKPLIATSDDPLVSSDVIGDPVVTYIAYKSIAGSDSNQASIRVIYDPITVQAANAMLMAAYVKETFM